MKNRFAKTSVRPILSTAFMLSCLSPSIQAGDVIVRVGSANVESGDSFHVPITIDSGTNTLGLYHVNISFDPAVLQFTGALGGEGLFAAIAVVNTNDTDRVGVLGLQGASLTGPTGSVLVARLGFVAIGQTGSSSALGFNVAEVFNTGSAGIGPTPQTVQVVNGLVNIGTVQDSDADGILDATDVCPNTPAESIVDGNGCSIDQLVPCDGPVGTGWKNHGQYVSGVAKAAKKFVAARLITAEQKDAIVSAAAQSDCGKQTDQDHNIKVHNRGRR